MSREFHIASMAEYVRKPTAGFLADFRAFIMRGNVIDLAAAFMMGVAFHNIIDTLIQGIITPALLKPAMNAVNITDIADLQYDGIRYGSFVASILSFFITALVLFLIIKAVESSRRGLVRALLHEHGDTHAHTDDKEASDSHAITKGGTSKEAQPQSSASNTKDPQQQLLAAIADLTKAIHSLGSNAPTPKPSSSARFDAPV
jgi:large conductance mechanosensitive channel